MSETMNDPVTHAESYPFPVMGKSYVFRDGMPYDMPDAGFDKTGRTPVLAAGSNQSHEQLLGMGIDAAVITACPRLAIEDGPTWPMPLLTVPETQIVLGRIKPDPYPFDEFA